MPSPAFLLARHLSPQTRWGPNDIPGGIPEFTAEDLRCATGYIGGAAAWMAVDAKWLGSAKSEDGLLKLTETKSWGEWETSVLKEITDRRKGMVLNWLMAELAYLDWMRPDNDRSDRGSAIFLSQVPDVNVTPHLYTTHYKSHVQTLANWLSGEESIGLNGVKRFILEVA